MQKIIFCYWKNSKIPKVPSSANQFLSWCCPPKISFRFRSCLISWSHDLMISWSHNLMISWSHDLMISCLSLCNCTTVWVSDWWPNRLPSLSDRLIVWHGCLVWVAVKLSGWLTNFLSSLSPIVSTECRNILTECTVRHMYGHNETYFWSHWDICLITVRHMSVRDICLIETDVWLRHMFDYSETYVWSQWDICLITLRHMSDRIETYVWFFTGFPYECLYCLMGHIEEGKMSAHARLGNL